MVVCSKEYPIREQSVCEEREPYHICHVTLTVHALYRAHCMEVI